MELQQLRFCLTAMARAASIELAEAMPAALTPALRRRLFDLFSEWSVDAIPGARNGV